MKTILYNFLVITLFTSNSYAQGLDSLLGSDGLIFETEFLAQIDQSSFLNRLSVCGLSPRLFIITRLESSIGAQVEETQTDSNGCLYIHFEVLESQRRQYMTLNIYDYYDEFISGLILRPAIR